MANEKQLTRLLNDYQPPAVRRVGNLYEDFSPEPWAISDVSVLYDDENEALGYYCTEESYRHGKPIYSLPDEIFNHQLKNLDIYNPEQVAKFMSKYGMIYHSTPQAETQMRMYNETISAKIKEPTLICDQYLKALNNEANSILKVNRNSATIAGYGGRQDTVRLWFDAYHNLDILYKQPEKRYPMYFLVSRFEVESCLEMMQSCVKLAKAFSKSENQFEIEQMMGWKWGDFYDTADWFDAYLNAHLTNIHPKIGVIYEGEGEKPSYENQVGGEDYEHSFDDGELFRGSFMKALALQIRDFNLHLNKSRQCKECGEIFITKQSPKKATSRTRSTSEFCCDKCKNNYAGKQYRKSEGYRLKQQREKERKQKNNS